MNLTMRDLFTSAFEATDPKRPAIVTAQGRLTYGELYDAALRLASWFDAAGVRPGEPIAIMLPNSVQYVVVDLAINLLGAVKVPLNDLLSPDDIGYIVDDARPVACVVDEPRAALLAGRRAGHLVATVLVVGGDSPNRWADALASERMSADVLAARDIDEDGPGLILYTGGTTGRSKGVLHTQRGLTINMLVHRIETQLDETDRLLLTSPLPHSAGFLLQAALLAGGSAHIRQRFDPADVLDLITRESITYLFVVPTMLYRLLDALDAGPGDISSIRTVLYGAAPMSPVRLAEAMGRFGTVFMQLYGQSEVPNFLTRLSRGDHRPAAGRLGSCGRACATVEIVIVDPATGERLPPGHAGEVVARTGFTMTGYLGLPAATADTLRDGWLHTGDIGYLDADGYLYIVDRLKDMVITGGMNVYTSEVERVLVAAAGVTEAAVIGLPDPDWGERVCAVIVPGPADEISLDDVDRHCRARLSAYKRPKQYVLVDRLPLTNYGKVDKKQLVADRQNEQSTERPIS